MKSHSVDFVSFSDFTLPIIIGVMAVIVQAYFVIRHFWIKTKCFYLMQQRLEQIEAQLEEEVARATRVHGDLYDKINEVNANLHLIMGKLEIETRK